MRQSLKATQLRQAGGRRADAGADLKPGRCEAPLSWAMSKTMTVIAAGVCAACAGISAEAGDFASSLQFDGMYTSDFFSNRRGGVARGDRHLANLDISAMLDVEHLWGARGLTLFVSG